MIDVVIDNGYRGATILQLEHSLENYALDTVIDIRWENTKYEVAVLNRNAGRKFRLFVEDMNARDRAVSLVGTVIQLDSSMLQTATAKLMIRPSYDWRTFSHEVGQAVSRSAVIKIAADAVRKGIQLKLAHVARDLVLHGTNATDADVLIRLKCMKEK